MNKNAEKIIEGINNLIEEINIYDYLRECKVPKNLKGEINTNFKILSICPLGIWKV